MPYDNTRALGWDTVPDQTTKPCGDYFSEHSFGHTGFTGTMVWGDYEKDLGIVLLTNRVFPNTSNTSVAILSARKDVSNEIVKALDLA